LFDEGQIYNLWLKKGGGDQTLPEVTLSGQNLRTAVLESRGRVAKTKAMSLYGYIDMAFLK
jgi:hypothetical protein